MNESNLEAAKFQKLFETASSAMALLKGEDFIYEMANTEYLRLVNHRKIIGKKLTDALPEIKDSPLPKIMRKVWETGEPFVGKELLVKLAKEDNGPLFDWYFDFTYSRIDVDGLPYGIYIHAIDVTEKVETAAKIEDAQRKLNIALESANMGTWDLDPLNNKVTWSARTNELFGVDPIDDLPLETAIKQIHPDDRERVLNAISEVLTPGSSGRYAIKYRTKKPDGTYRLLNLIGRSYFKGQIPVHFTGIAQDITEENKLQQEIENRELEFRTLANSIPQLCWMADPTGAVYWYNQRWFDYTGTTLEEMKDWGWKKIMDPETLQEITKRWIKSLETATPFEMTFKLKSKEGHYRWFLTRSLPIKDSSGKIIKWFGSNTDIDDQIKVENDLKRKSHELEGVLGHMLEGLILSDHEGNLLHWNKAALKMHHFKDGEDVVNKLRESPDLFEISTLDHRVLTLDEWPLSRVLRGENVHNFEAYLRRKDTGYQFVANYSGTPLYDENGKIYLAIITVSDITARIENQEALKRALKVRDEFISVASHELKTPLTALIMQAQLQKKLINRDDPKSFDRDRIEKLFAQNERLYMRLNRLVEDMLDISRLRTGKLFMQKVSADLCDLTREILDRLHSEFVSTGIEQPEITCSQIIGEFDILRIEQVITNLITNALRYGQNKPIKVWIDEDEKIARLHVQDRGIGIAPEDQDKIFDRFERAISSNEISGLGLGLYIANQIAKEHGGSITLKSTLNEGSTFTLHLPKKPIS